MTSYALLMRLFAEIVLCWDELLEKRPFSPMKPLKTFGSAGTQEPFIPLNLGPWSPEKPLSLGSLALWILGTPDF